MQLRAFITKKRMNLQGLGQFELPTFEEFMEKAEKFTQSAEVLAEFEVFMAAKDAELRAIAAVPIPEADVPFTLQRVNDMDEQVFPAFQKFLEEYVGPEVGVSRAKTLMNSWNKTLAFVKGALGVKVELPKPPGKSLLDKIKDILAGFGIGAGTVAAASLVGAYLLTRGK